MVESDKSVDTELWNACAGGTVEIPTANTHVFYFPQGHAEHALANVDFGSLGRIPPLILCRVAYVKYLADPETDEVYAKTGLIPLKNNEFAGFDDESKMCDSGEKPMSLAKTLTQSDANNGGGFSVPRYCAETIFPPLDYGADPPVQNLIARDIHGDTWKFRHIYRGTPRRHLLTTGWSTFVNHKKLVAGDSIVFLQAENGDLCIGIRRAKRESGTSSLWNYAAANFGDENKLMQTSVCGGGKTRVRPESVVEAAFLAANGHPFEVVYYPRAGTPEFCVKASSVREAMRIQWCPGMRFKMAFENEDSSRISWFMGTVASVQFYDPHRWPGSPWRLLQVIWDEPDLLQNVKSVSPWLVEMVSSIPLVSISPMASPRKKLRFPNPMDFTANGRFPIPSFLGNPLRPGSCLRDSFTAGIQGARQYNLGLGVPFSDLRISNEMQMELLPPSFPQHDFVNLKTSCITEDDEDISCLLSMGCNTSETKSHKRDHGARTPSFILFGQPILTEQQMSHDQQSSESFSPSQERTSCGVSWKQDADGLCKVYLGSKDIGQTLYLSDLGSYEDLYNKLEHIFEIERSEIIGSLFYDNATGSSKQVMEEEPFSEFVKSAKRLIVQSKTGFSVKLGL